jgi:hypothetical protein
MGLIGTIMGGGRAAERIGGAVGGVAEVFIGNRAERDEADLERMKATLDQYGSEFEKPPAGPFDRFTNSLNRLPRPLLALGTIGLFAYGMAEPVGFSARMQGLALVPEPLWWLMGAIVSFYFGSRELHHFRNSRRVTVGSFTSKAADETAEKQASEPAPFLGKFANQFHFGSSMEPKVEVRACDPEFNAALEEWRLTRSGR